MRIAVLALLLVACTSRTDFSPLVEAVRAGDVAAVRTLAAQGADLNAHDARNWTPLLHAVHTGQVGTGAALLELGASVEEPANHRATPLMYAAAYDSPEMVALLLRHRASTTAVDEDGLTALDHAIIGIADPERFTWMSCSDYTERQLAPVSPTPLPGSIRWAKIKRCA